MKALKSLPAFIRPIVEQAKPAAVGLAVVGAGAFAAQAGGAVAKAMSAQIEAFAAKSVWHEAAVDAGAGTIVDAALLAGVTAWKGAKVAYQCAPLLMIGTGASALAPAVAHYFAMGVDKIVALVDRTPASAQAGAAPAVAPSGFPLALPPPGGVSYGSAPTTLGDYSGLIAPPGGTGIFDEFNAYAGAMSPRA